jgi:imidazolonepropionase-like amidohydrolase
MKFFPSLFFCFGILISFGQDRSYIHCGNLLDAESFELQPKMTLVVENGIISKVEKGFVNAPSGFETIDLKDKTVLPGLMDMHVHIEFETNPNRYLQRFTMNDADIAFQSAVFAKRLLMAGFTTVRDLGGSGVNVSLQKAIAQGLTDGPTIFTACKSIAVTGGHADPTNGGKKDLFDYPGPEQGVADGPDACRQAVRQQVKNGADLIKITATGGVLSVARDGYRPAFTQEELNAIIETANDFGIHVAAHAHGDEGMRRAVEAGITSIEHGTLMSEETMDLMVKKGTWYVPTITAGKAVADSALIPNYYPSVVVPKALAIGPKIQETFGKAYKKGVKIAFGTDSGVFAHGKNAMEFQYMVEAGMPADEAIKSATVSTSELLGISDKVGTIKVGKQADIIAVSGNPLSDIKTLQDVRFVMKKGKVYKNEK